MKVRLKFFAGSREAVGMSELLFDAAEQETVGDVVARLTKEYPKLAILAPRCLLAVNREFAGSETKLSDGDEIAILPPVSGGLAMFEIVEHTISIEDVVKKVEHEGIGAVVTFTGLVRRHSRGKRVSFLEYEAYPEMAVAKMEQIGREIKERWKIDRVAITHRIGHLEVGEASIVIAVAAEHRHAAFEACHYAIDRLKVIVPVWKKEVWEDGEVWVGLEDDGAYAGT